MVYEMTKRFGIALMVAGTLLTAGACQRSVGQTTPEIPGTCPAVTVMPDNGKLLSLQDDIRLLAMLNRMQLTADQINQLLPLTEKLEQQRGLAQAEQTALQADLEKALTAKRDLLLADKPVPEPLETQISTIQSHQDAAAEKARTALAEAAKALRPIFTADQLEIVTGRYEARLQARELLDWLRGLSDNDFGEEANSNADGLADPDKGFSKEALVKLFGEARKLTATQYEKQRDDYAKKLAPLYGVSEQDENNQIAGAFSHPRMADLLREKLKVIGGGAG